MPSHRGSRSPTGSSRRTPEPTGTTRIRCRPRPSAGTVRCADRRARRRGPVARRRRPTRWSTWSPRAHLRRHPGGGRHGRLAARARSTRAAGAAAVDQHRPDAAPGLGQRRGLHRGRRSTVPTCIGPTPLRGTVMRIPAGGRYDVVLEMPVSPVDRRASRARRTPASGSIPAPAAEPLAGGGAGFVDGPDLDLLGTAPPAPVAGMTGRRRRPGGDAGPGPAGAVPRRRCRRSPRRSTATCIPSCHRSRCGRATCSG